MVTRCFERRVNVPPLFASREGRLKFARPSFKRPCRDEG
jgi:hypothetical protein